MFAFHIINYIPNAPEAPCFSAIAQSHKLTHIYRNEIMCVLAAHRKLLLIIMHTAIHVCIASETHNL